MILSLNLAPKQCLPDKAAEISEDVIYQSDPYFNSQWVEEEINYCDRVSEASLST